ncbi:MAG: 4-hydroxy-3-methylbut-2-en-1-yl diphosphate synthase [Sphingobacteriales bacterium]|nr:MAG: 4-hydroxy-3-methylbut-2-en-1-yl diphosphate synthase [Sphingobacteriales bacterium]
MYRLHTREVRVGNLAIGGTNPVRIQTMTTTDTLDIDATVAQTIRCIEAGAELVRITAPSKKEAEALGVIKERLRAAGYDTPLVADIHFTPNAAEIAARLIEKVRVNPGNYVDKKKFDFIEYTDTEYAAEVDRIRERFTPLVRICKEYGTAMRIGTNHGSLSDRIMSRYGDTAIGMVESAMEFLRIARNEDYHQIVLSMKSSNPIVMVEAYRLLVRTMLHEFGECYPLHLGVTEAGDGEDGRIKSAIGIGTLLEEGIGDTIRVSLTEDPEFELPVCKDLVKKALPVQPGLAAVMDVPDGGVLPTSPFMPANETADLLNLRRSVAVRTIGGGQVPVVMADFMKAETVVPEQLEAIGYQYDAPTDKWAIADGAADYLFLGAKAINFALPGTVRPVVFSRFWKGLPEAQQADYLPLFSPEEWKTTDRQHSAINFMLLDVKDADRLETQGFFRKIESDPTIVLCVYCTEGPPKKTIAQFLQAHPELTAPVIICDMSAAATVDEQLIDFSVTSGALFLDGLGDGIWLMNDPDRMQDVQVSGRTYLPVGSTHQFLNNTAFSILQATRKRISKTEYISCPSCGRTLFDLQETTAKIRSATHHLKGVKIAIMGCIVNGPGEMADADFGYVGSGPGKITLYKNKDIVRKNIDSEVAVEELINLLKEHGAWTERVS